ncbi:hypothetical protein [Oscillatoria sp. HE19RPO]|uniref:ribbon-helix-helix domain-containing protein n=1 Tax=Oscillatoria sp. HE19RPO TaxID=2954806 RepID=UPI0020C51747|nr:hypothetical protein [Oscillatoria sp. HE19RPO]
MTQLNISLPESIQFFIEQQVAQGNYGTVNDYILHLILQEQAKIARVEPLLLEGLDSGEFMEVTDEWWETKRSQLVQKIQDTQARMTKKIFITPKASQDIDIIFLTLPKTTRMQHCGFLTQYVRH